MKIYTIKSQPFGEDAVPKEVHFAVASAVARGERIFVLDARPCSPYLRTAARHALSAMKRSRRIEFFVPAERLGTEDVGAALLCSRAPEVMDMSILTEDGEREGLFVVSL